jgi:hypothetical protein
MSNVMCRPELHDATTREQYDAFHAEMDELGLEQTITRDGKVFRLPTGLYLGLNVSMPLELLLIRISLSAIKITGYDCKLMLTPIGNPDDIRISGLEEITPSYRGLFGALFATPPAPPAPPFPLLPFFNNKRL